MARYGPIRRIVARFQLDGRARGRVLLRLECGHRVRRTAYAASKLSSVRCGKCRDALCAEARREWKEKDRWAAGTT